jgi:hypothetical protein
LIAVVMCGLGWCLSGCTGPADLGPKPNAAEPSASQPLLLTSTASCSGRSCHGGLEPQPGQQIRQDEYTAWLTHDKHAHAYQVLFNERSKKIAAHLGITNGNAHEDLRCLSCHLTPFAAAKGLSPASPTFRTAWVEAEAAFGVGCTSCHGAAEQWISAHTMEEWQKLGPKEKHARGMVPVQQPEYLAQACVGCHVGAPPGKQVPLTRDVNHDLIAAGHPRLNFELAVFMANLPPHWNEAAKTKRVQEDGGEPQLWATGQLVSAQAALDLLTHRAEDKTRPWPEFAEYGCFACHHDLAGEKSWRQQAEIGLTRPRGSLPWGTWYLAMPRLLADGSLKALTQLEKTMQHAAPDRALVAKQAHAARQQLQTLQTPDGKAGRKLLQKWLTALGSDSAILEPSWDVTTQLYLAAYALEPASKQALQEATKALAFPEDFDSPRNFNPGEVLKRMKELPR